MGEYAVYASVEQGVAWKRVGVFDSVEGADERAAGIVRGYGTFGLDAEWEYGEALVVELASGGEATEELPLDRVAHVRSRFTRGAEPPGPAMELTEENAFEMAEQP